MSHSADKAFQQRMQRVEVLLQEIERFTDPRASDTARAVVQALLELHGAGLATMLELVTQTGARGQELIEVFAGDDLVANLLLLHGLHPLDVEARVCAALDKVRPQLHAHKGDVELLAISDGAVRLRLHRSDESCASSATLKFAVEEAISAAAPDIFSIEIEVPAGNGSAAGGRLALPLVR